VSTRHSTPYGRVCCGVVIGLSMETKIAQVIYFFNDFIKLSKDQLKLQIMQGITVKKRQTGIHADLSQDKPMFKLLLPCHADANVNPVTLATT
jgi:hypothetical protein